MGTKGADVTEVRDTGVDVERGYCYTSDIPASRVLFHLFCYHGVGWGGGRGTEGVSCLQSPNPTFQDRVEEGDQCLPRVYSAR